LRIGKIARYRVWFFEKLVDEPLFRNPKREARGEPCVFLDP